MNSVKNFLFPKFSELDLYILTTSLVIPFIFNPSNLTLVYRQLGESDALEVFLLIVFLIFLALKVNLTNKVHTLKEKTNLAGIFYITLTILTGTVAFDYFVKTNIFSSKFNIIQLVNFILMMILLLKSALSFFLLLVIGKLKLETLASQVSDRQSKLFELLLITIIGVVVYLFVKNNDVHTMVILLYIYTSLFYNMSCKIKPDLRIR